jgi:hypothetical protein
MKFTLKTKIELVIAFLIIAAIPAVIIYNHNANRIYLYEANNRYTKEPAEIGSDDSYNIGDTVIVDETNFIDMNDVMGTQYIITKDNGSIFKK